MTDGSQPARNDCDRQESIGIEKHCRPRPIHRFPGLALLNERCVQYRSVFTSALSEPIRTQLANYPTDDDSTRFVASSSVTPPRVYRAIAHHSIAQSLHPSITTTSRSVSHIPQTKRPFLPPSNHEPVWTHPLRLRINIHTNTRHRYFYISNIPNLRVLVPVDYLHAILVGLQHLSSSRPCAIHPPACF